MRCRSESNDFTQGVIRNLILNLSSTVFHANSEVHKLECNVLWCLCTVFCAWHDSKQSQNGNKLTRHDWPDMPIPHVPC